MNQTKLTGEILVIDDQPLNIKLLTSIMLREGFTVNSAVDGEEAFSILKKQLPDLILLDIRLPGMDGYEVCERLKKVPRTADIPVIILSILDKTEDKVRALKSGAVDFITKPFSVEEVISRVRTHLSLRNLHLSLERQNQQLKSEIADRERVENALQLIAEGISATIGDEFFRRLVQHLSETLNVNYAFVGELFTKNGGEQWMKTQAVFSNGRIVENFEYCLAHSPCENVLAHGLCFYPQQVQQLFPLDHLLVEMGIESYLGTPLYETSGHSFGILVVMDDQPMIFPEMAASTLQIFAVHAATELERKQTEVKLKHTLEHLEEMVEARTAELEQTQSRLVRQEKLAALGKLAGNIGHELRNPLGAIKNSAYFLEMSVETDDPEVKEALNILNYEVNKSADIIQTLLNFARTKISGKELSPVEQMLRSAVAEVGIPDGVDVVWALDEAAPLVLVDKGQFNRVLCNLIRNAFDAMPEGGQLCLSTAVIPDHIISISIKDSGVGIPPENLELLFEPLFTTKPKGIGLGLALAQGLIEAHDGRIVVISQPGQGSEFIIQLPQPHSETHHHAQI